jgi:hypothetical protein
MGSFTEPNKNIIINRVIQNFSTNSEIKFTENDSCLEKESQERTSGIFD